MADSFSLPSLPTPVSLVEAVLQIQELNTLVRKRVEDCLRLHGLVCSADALLKGVKTNGAGALAEGHAVTIMADIAESSGDTLKISDTTANLYHRAHTLRHIAENKAKTSDVAMRTHRDAGALCHLYLTKALDNGHHFGDAVVTGDLSHHAIAQRAVADNAHLFSKHHQENLK